MSASKHRKADGTCTAANSFFHSLTSVCVWRRVVAPNMSRAIEDKNGLTPTARTPAPIARYFSFRSALSAPASVSKRMRADTRSGHVNAARRATMPPMESPHQIACASLSWSRTATTSETASYSEKGRFTSLDLPWPRRSGLMTRNLPTRAGTCSRHILPEHRKLWPRTTGVPVPTSSKKISRPCVYANATVNVTVPRRPTDISDDGWVAFTCLPVTIDSPSPILPRVEDAQDADVGGDQFVAHFVIPGKNAPDFPGTEARYAFTEARLS